MSTDPSGMLEDDLETISSLWSGDGMDTSIPALVELAFGSLTAISALAWIVLLFFVPDVVGGQAWMALGGLALVLFGVPAGVVYVLRRGGSDVLMAMIREHAG